MHPTRTRHIPAERPNIIEYDEKSTTDLHHNIHKPHRGRHTILLDIPASPPRVFLRNLQGWTQAGQTQTWDPDASNILSQNMHWKQKPFRLWRTTWLPILYPALPSNIGIWLKVQIETFRNNHLQMNSSNYPRVSDLWKEKYHHIRSKKTSPEIKKCHAR